MSVVFNLNEGFVTPLHLIHVCLIQNHVSLTRALMEHDDVIILVY